MPNPTDGGHLAFGQRRVTSCSRLCHRADTMCVADPQAHCQSVFICNVLCRRARQQRVPNETKQGDELGLGGIE